MSLQHNKLVKKFTELEQGQEYLNFESPNNMISKIKKDD